jgi:hypothetical protein
VSPEIDCFSMTQSAKVDNCVTGNIFIFYATVAEYWTLLH